MVEMLSTSVFWIALAEIVFINIMLSGDNAVVIALASRSLPARQQKQAIVFGSVGAIVLRVVLTFFAALLLEQPWLKLVGGAMLLWIGASMMVSDDDEADLDAHAYLWAAIRTIMVADLVMSLDNVIGVAAAAKGNVVLLVLGLGISIPLIIVGSQLILKLMERFPLIVTMGSALLGWVAGEMLVTDAAIAPWVDAQAHALHTVVPAVCAVLVVIAGRWLDARAQRKSADASASASAGERGAEAEPAAPGEPA
jgi:YjbE family integral membrane protein